MEEVDRFSKTNVLVRKDEIDYRSAGSPSGEDAAAMAAHVEAVGERGEVEVQGVAHAEGVKSGGQASRSNPENANLARDSMNRACNHGVKGRKNSVEEGRTWGEVLHAVATQDRQGCRARGDAVGIARGCSFVARRRRAGGGIRITGCRRHHR
jgi:hypothetical protein